MADVAYPAMANQSEDPAARREDATPIVPTAGDESVSGHDDSIPIIHVSSPSQSRRSASSSGRLSKLRSRSQSRIDDMAASVRDRLQNMHTQSDSPSSMQDKLLNLLLSQIIPTEDSSGVPKAVDRRSRKYVDRPGFSVGAMSNNFRRFNARIGPVFVFQNRMIRLFTWRTPTHTLSFLAAYSFICLDPHLVIVTPLAVCLLFIMIPAFLARHPPPPMTLPAELYPLGGPPLAPPPRIKPASDLSKDFFRNMRDLQNSMDDFSKMHDQLLAALLPPTNFSDEALSSTLFIGLFLSTLTLFVSAHLVPWRLVALLTGWVGICANHPALQDFLHSATFSTLSTPTPSKPSTPMPDVSVTANDLHSQLRALADADILLDPDPSRREVEIFELQHRNPYDSTSEWEPWLFTPQPHDPLSPAVIAGDRPKGTRFFEDVVAPPGWRWAEKKWSLDLLSREWVEERCITGVEVEVEGERWVSDLAPADRRAEAHDPAPDAASTTSSRSTTDAELKPAHSRSRVVTWEEGNGGHSLGEWRRRRWVRVVERVLFDSATWKADDGIVLSLSDDT